MKSNPSDHGRPDRRQGSGGPPKPRAKAEGLRYQRPREMEDALARVSLGRLGSTILYYPTIGSTNDVAADLVARRLRAEGASASLAEARVHDERAEAGRLPPSTGSGCAEALEGQPSGGDDVEGAVVVADEQTAGRGRRGHTWFSPAGSGLYVSVVLAPSRARVDPARATSLLTLGAGVAIAEAIESVTGLAVDLKWPNDLYVARRKLAGILAEGSASGSAIDVVILGYGINIGPMAYPPELADRATSLGSELGRAIDRHALFAATLFALAQRYEDLLEGRFDAILDAWRRRAPTATGARVSWTTPSGQQAGITEGIDDHGALLVRVRDRVERIVAGELVWS